MDPSTSQQVVAGVAAAAGLACLACHRQAPAPPPAPPPAVDDDSRPWLVLVAGEHWQTTSGKRWLGQHCSLQWIARIYDQLNDMTQCVAIYKQVLSYDSSNVEAISCLASNFFYTDQPGAPGLSCPKPYEWLSSHLLHGCAVCLRAGATTVSPIASNGVRHSRALEQPRPLLLPCIAV